MFMFLQRRRLAWWLDLLVRLEWQCGIHPLLFPSVLLKFSGSLLSLKLSGLSSHVFDPEFAGGHLQGCFSTSSTLCQQLAELLLQFQSLPQVVCSIQTVVDIVRRSNHFCCLGIGLLVVCCQLKQHSCGQEGGRGNAKFQAFHPAVLDSGSLGMN